MTSDGRAVLSAGTKGDNRRVLDVASRAREKIARRREREQQRQERQQAQVTRKREQAAEIQGEIDELSERLEQLAGVGQDVSERARVQARIEQLQERMEKLESEADELEAKEIGPFELKAIGTFRAGIRASVRGLWNGALDEADFINAMRSAIERGLREAWITGAAECGIKPDELTQAEQFAMRQAINSQFAFLFGFATDIAENSRANGGKLGPLYQRAELWINQYNSVQGQAKLMACRDKKMIWTIDPTKDNCPSCLKLNQKVKRASFWAEREIRPQNAPNGKLECEGWKCGCSLDPTDDPLSKGPLPNLP
jgi:hypothetical protein